MVILIVKKKNKNVSIDGQRRVAMTDEEKKAIEELKICKTCAYRKDIEACLCEVDYNFKKTVLNLIEKQEKELSDKQEDINNLIADLEKQNVIDNETVKRYERQYRAIQANNSFYKHSYRRQIDMANARINIRKYVIEYFEKEVMK